VDLVGQGRARTTLENGWFLGLAKGRIFRLVATGQGGAELGTLTDR
jgi:hypothetical protein